ncbi:MAG: N-acetylglucosamine-6-phosphate deacetylase [Synergistaceae bacterium]|nr:N-acetylglucosamine-6-phosphate deacetylase [Synergistaceae bacterium]
MKNYIIKNAIILNQDFEFHRGDLKISNGLIVDYEPSNAEIIDAENFYVVPGLIDIHFHGCAGHDFCEGTHKAFKKILDYENSVGVTTICPATMTLPEEKLISITRAAKNFSGLAGIYLEGPFISKNRVGAQNPAYVANPDIKLLDRLQNTSGNLIKIAAIAPEVEGAFDFINEAKNLTRLTLAHTTCDYDTATRAFASGVSQVTHMFNAMLGISHRNPGPIIAALENENVSVELICDGVHIHPAVVRNTIKIFGSDRVIFISDSMEATGMPDGEYELGGLKVIKRGNLATLEDEKTIAGSVTNLFDCVRISVAKMNVPLEVAIKCASLNPARAIGIEKSHGSIQAGKVANLILLDKDLNLVSVIHED